MGWCQLSRKLLCQFGSKLFFFNARVYGVMVADGCSLFGAVLIGGTGADPEYTCIPKTHFGEQLTLFQAVGLNNHMNQKPFSKSVHVVNSLFEFCYLKFGPKCLCANVAFYLHSISLVTICTWQRQSVFYKHSTAMLPKQHSLCTTLYIVTWSMLSKHFTWPAGVMLCWFIHL